MSSDLPSSHHPATPPQALIFDLMGTCTDWKTSICTALSQSTSLGPRLAGQHAQFAADWRAGFFDEIHARFRSGGDSEDIDVTHRRVDEVLVDETERQRLVGSWHSQVAWPDASEAISRLKTKYMVFVFFDLPPDPAIYRKALQLLQLSPQDATMVAAHAYDLRAAKQIGLKTIYIRRGTEDIEENMDTVRHDVDIFMEDHSIEQSDGRGPLTQLADYLL
ncbi:HAD-like protein [Aspergillus steynii IBT 23096]|uniref:HAD-like protein n=1 Tax=Aspergillus steynii IBT 23096 TaxID=1392250 RepID=A0A2I2G6W3_9EURO|nr:HAD-like protein [Aspergillus steynii IBT 23096]PLB48613.1 HAD-like protein [Aspergillus steynii IBT 23096]